MEKTAADVKTIKNIDAKTHTRGESMYLDDLPLLGGTLFGAAFVSPVAHGKITSLDLSIAIRVPGVVKIFTYQDIPGENQIGGIVPDEPLLAEQEVHFAGMPIAFVVAESEKIARKAVQAISIKVDRLPVVTDPRIAKENSSLIVPPRTFMLGNIDAAWNECTHIVAGEAYSNGQEHLYIETQGSYAIPMENGGIKIYSSTQSPTAGQKVAAKILGIPMHQVEVEVTRIGGGFGGKEDQANSFAGLCALACNHLKKPVKYSLHRMEDMMITGKRHPYSSDFKIGLNADYKILAYEVTFFQNAGAAADLSPAILERTLFHCTNSYFIPHVKATAYSCRTNLPPNTAFRGFGGPQAMFVLESAIAKAAEVIGVNASDIQKKNLNTTGDEFPYGQLAVSEAKTCWERAETLYEPEKIKKAIDQYNVENRYSKRGMAFMPVCFGISFTNTSMNQARALVHIYYDGSIAVSTGAVEMGQGVNTKMLQVAASVFTVPGDLVKILSTNTTRIANTSPSAASATADLNGKAVFMACTALYSRIIQVASEVLSMQESKLRLQDGWVWNGEEKTDLDWKIVVNLAFLKRVSLSEHAHYATPEVHFDKTKEKGHPFAYHVYGTAITTVTLDCLRGIYEIDAVKIVHDFGKSMNTAIDRGQIEGGVVQGMGWMTMEEVVYDAQGILKSNALSTYKVPDIYSVPKTIEIDFLKTENQNLAIFNSKAVGEPPFMYGIGTYFALRNSIKAFNPSSPIGFDAPMTPEKVLLSLYERQKINSEAENKKPGYLETNL